MSFRPITDLTRYKLNKLETLFSESDSEYRQLLVDGYRDLDLNDNKILLLYILCAHANITQIHDNVDLKYIDDSYINLRGIFNNLTSNYNIQPQLNTSIADIPNVKYKLNKNQNELMSDRGWQIEFTDCADPENGFITQHINLDIPSESVHSKRDKRSLVLYFRRESQDESDCVDHNIQMDYFEFVLIAYILDKLIVSSGFLVFDELIIVSREPGLYPEYIHDVVPNCTYKSVRGVDFITTTSLYANCINFFMGTMHCSSLGAIPILANSMLLHEPYRQTDYIHYNLSYGTDNTDDYVYDGVEYTDIYTAYKNSQYCLNHNLDDIVHNTIEMFDSLTLNLISTI